MIHIGEVIDGKYHFHALILSGSPLYKRGLDNFVVDLASMVYHKERLTVDYVHDENRIIGYAENFTVTEKGLEADIYLLAELPLVQEITALAKAGTPYEMSPTIAEYEGELTSLGEGDVMTVNGREVQGRIDIYRNVPMRGVAICPFGTDRFTTLTLLKEQLMNKKQEPNLTKLAEDAVKEEPKKSAYPELDEFIAIFGETQGVQLYRDGASIDDARKYKELIDKFGVPASKTADSGQQTAANEPNSVTEKEPQTQEPNSVNPVKKDDEKTHLKATLDNVCSVLTKLSDKVSRLESVVPRGEQPVSHQTEAPSAKPLNALDADAQKMKLPK